MNATDAPDSPVTSKSPKYRRHEPVMIHTINPALGPLSNKALNRAGTMSPMTTPSTPFFHPSRPRADSTAARLAMEAMIQERLDQLTRRLDDFNQQSFDLYTRTQQLAVEFQAKSKRLYQIEDHLLKIQGKPGLSDDFLAHGPQPRRLTNDLEELRIGVKTLRKKFQIAGSVVATVGWWQHMKQSAPDQPLLTGKPLTPMRTLSKKKEKLPLEKIFTDISEATSELSPNDTHLHASPIHKVNLLGLRSPPLTPKGPLSGSSLLVGLGFDKGDVLPVIPDHDIDMAPSTIMTTTPSFLDDAMLDKTRHANTNKFDEGGSEEDPPVPVPAFLEFAHSSPSPSHVPLSEKSGSVETTQESTPESEPVAFTRAHPTQEEDNKDEEVLTMHKIEEHDGLQTPLSSLSEENPILIEDSVEETLLPKDDEPDKDNQNKPVDFTASPTQEAADTWVQAFWRFLIRIEYLVLGTAVLGAMMPDNIYALCAGFFSALVYASLVIFHRVAAPPGSEAPKPPTGRRVVVSSSQS
ncbi:hypothetical protein MVEG_01989 [Podila verticillata NRRL 6337]|nr:hypothetical protein MVEG_01989 [Podila verticillata NRRL 6337]